MRIRWFGHSCFFITSEKGVRIVTDPFKEGIGYKPPDVEADIVTVSHNHMDHNNVKAVRGNYRLFDQPGRFSVNDVGIEGFSTFHSNDSIGKVKNVIFKMNFDGFNVCHCGDLGHTLDKVHVEKIRPVDILMIPVGGWVTINYRIASEIMKMLKPTVTIAMHYKTDVLNFPLDKVDLFLSETNGKMLKQSEIEINNENLREYSGAIAMNYS